MKNWIKKLLNWKPKIQDSIIQQIKKSWNKNINIIISDKYQQADLTLFDGDVIHYPPETKIGRILIDTGIAKSWSEVKASQWNNYEIQCGFTDLLLDGLKVRPDDNWSKIRNLGGFRPHRLTILKWEDKEEIKKQP